MALKPSYSLPPLLLLPLLLGLGSHVIAPAAAQCHADDEAGLVAFKAALSDPSRLLTAWEPGTDCCRWPNVICGNGTRVTGLRFFADPDSPAPYLTGRLSPSISLLTHLELFDVGNFRPFIVFSGPVHAGLLRLPRLTSLTIRGSNLSGPLPPFRSAGLQFIDLSGNRISGPIPPSIAILTKLTTLNLIGNLLSGSIPAGFSGLRNLVTIDLGFNRLSGPIPDLSGLTELDQLYLQSNQLSGPIPGLATSLTYLDLSVNRLSGRIPEFIAKSTNLTTLRLSANNFTGPLPQNFKNLANLNELNISRNHLTDPFPNMTFRQLLNVDLSYNRFHLGTIPEWVIPMQEVAGWFRLAGCGIWMRMEDWKPPPTKFGAYRFGQIDLSDNRIRGSPVELLEQARELTEFRAAGNKLRFNMTGMALPASLKYLDLSRNSAFGSVPGSIAGLTEVNVSYNHLCGRLPANKFPASAFVGNDCLCGPPLLPCKES